MRVLGAVLSFFLAACLFADEPQPTTLDACFQVEWTYFAGRDQLGREVWNGCGGSAVCIATDGKQSLLLTNNHVVSVQPGAGAPFPRANCPLDVVLKTIDFKTVYAAKVVAADPQTDIALIVINTKLPTVKLRNANAPVGTPVWMRGQGGKQVTRGNVLPYVQSQDWPCSRFNASLRSINGDSGAGVFDANGRFVAINCGLASTAADAPQRGAPVDEVFAAVKNAGNGVCPKLIEKIERE